MAPNRLIYLTECTALGVRVGGHLPVTLAWGIGPYFKLAITHTTGPPILTSSAQIDLDLPILIAGSGSSQLFIFIVSTRSLSRRRVYEVHLHSIGALAGYANLANSSNPR